jgi:hypothetical protein
MPSFLGTLAVTQWGGGETVTESPQEKQQAEQREQQEKAEEEERKRQEKAAKEAQK